MTVLNRALWIALGFAGLIAVGIGAYGAHAAGFDDVAHDRFASALLYHLVHLGALAAALLLVGRKASRLATAGACLFLLGILLFSGSLYVSAFSGGATPTTLAPYGGMSFMLGWLALGIAGARSVPGKY
ncbi:DUF423 domain-containing protein [Nisaea nitritireducens]|uniref:DUF423 domain-containing protein n=1 Tax=Nisaea nitritireducens TaxID=568392 RepID=UPI0018662BF2|nr:DUF423 domain-containing protein [Nisaea nitritireducens]